MAEISTNKRRRKEGLQLFDLPNNAVAHVATYLSNISRAIFAISSPSASQSTILSSDEKLWETLDFGDIDKSLAGRLNDGGLRDILTIVDAASNTKCLKLTGCTNIWGTGLSPLSNSIVLKQLDMSIVGQNDKSPNMNPQPYISEVSIEILTSIINTEGNSLTSLQLPKKWRSKREHRHLTVFLRRYNEVLASRGIKCTKCNILVSEASTNYDGHVYCDLGDTWFGQQNDICYKCLKSYCNECQTDDERNWIEYCNHCEKDFCADCSSIVRCDSCVDVHCSGCEDTLKTCQRCKSVVCGRCTAERCSCVNRFLCVECAPESHKCEWGECNERFCVDCQDDHLHSHRVFK